MRATHVRQLHPLRGSLLVLLVLATAWSSAAVAEHVLPAPLLQEGFKAQRVGAGLLTWFGFDIYEASLWSTDGDFANFDPAADAQRQVAFSLWYRRSFSRERLIEITTSGWSEFKLASPEQQQRWRADLARLWVDVNKGSNLTTVVLPGGETRFYDAQRRLGSIADPAFGPAFLRIWLDERTRGTRLESLRTALLGNSAAARAGCVRMASGKPANPCN